MPVAAGLGVAAGTGAGILVSHVGKRRGWSKWQRIGAVALSHFAASAVTMPADATAVVAAPVGATVHALVEAVVGESAGPVGGEVFHWFAQQVGDEAVSDAAWRLATALWGPGEDGTYAWSPS